MSNNKLIILLLEYHVTPSENAQTPNRDEIFNDFTEGEA